METYGLIGFPLVHSFSAAFFAKKFEAEGIAAEYRNFEMETVDALPELVKNKDLRGLNVTIPHKQNVIPLLDEMSDEARAIRAVNVIRVTHDGEKVLLKGYNSDVIGFCDSLRPLLQPHHRRALVLGTGGASKAVVYGLRTLGIAPTYVSRHAAPGGKVGDTPCITYAGLSPEVMAEHLLVVNCSPVGMFPHTDEAPAIPYGCLSPRHLLYDLVYNPEETQFLRNGAAHGCTVKNGLEMLHLQALASWRFWHEGE